MQFMQTSPLKVPEDVTLSMTINCQVICNSQLDDIRIMGTFIKGSTIFSQILILILIQHIAQFRTLDIIIAIICLSPYLFPNLNLRNQYQIYKGYQFYPMHPVLTLIFSFPCSQISWKVTCPFCWEPKCNLSNKITVMTINILNYLLWKITFNMVCLIGNGKQILF